LRGEEVDEDIREGIWSFGRWDAPWQGGHVLLGGFGGAV
jgi:hypothetical protein